MRPRALHASILTIGLIAGPVLPANAMVPVSSNAPHVVAAAAVADTACAAAEAKPAPPAEDGQVDEPGMFDIAGRTRAAFENLMRDLAADTLQPVLGLLGCTLLSTPQVTGVSQVRVLWQRALAIANVLLIVFVMAGGLVVMSYETLQFQYTIKDVAPRIVTGMLAANCSWWIAGGGINAANSLSAALARTAGGRNVWSALLDLTQTSSGVGSLFITLLTVVVAVLAAVLLLTYVVRVALVVLLTAAAPLMLCCHAHPSSEFVASWWWRAFIGCLGVQVAQTFVIVAAVSVFFTANGSSVLGLPGAGGIVNMLIAICLFVVLLAIPGWVTGVITGRHRPGVRDLAKPMAIYRSLRNNGSSSAGSPRSGGPRTSRGSRPAGSRSGGSRPGFSRSGTTAGTRANRRPSQSGTDGAMTRRRNASGPSTDSEQNQTPGARRAGSGSGSTRQSTGSRSSARGGSGRGARRPVATTRGAAASGQGQPTRQQAQAVRRSPQPAPRNRRRPEGGGR